LIDCWLESLCTAEVRVLAGYIESFTGDHFIPKTFDRPFAFRAASGFNANALAFCTEQLRAQAGFPSTQFHPPTVVFLFR